MARMLPDPTFYPSPRMAGQAPAEALAYVALLAPEGNGKKDALGVVDTDPHSSDYGRLVGKLDFPNAGNELHHFGWNACSSHLCAYAPNPHMERRYLVLPGTGSSRIHVVDTAPDSRRPRLVKVIEGEEVMAKTGYSAPHTVHCGPDGLYMNALGGTDGDGPGGIFMLDHETFEVRGKWERDRGPQYLAYDFGWHLGQDVMITSERGTPNMVKDGVNPELLLAGKYGHALHVWDLRRRTHLQTLELGAEQQMVLELRPAHDPRQSYGFAGVCLSLADLSSAIFIWFRDERSGKWATRKVIEIPAEPADPTQLPPLLQGFKAVPPLVTDINLSLDDRFLYVSCWGTGELRQYDVSDPFAPKLTGTLQIGGIVRRAPHPKSGERALNGGPQMVEVSRDGRRVYVTNSLYSPWDAQFYPDGIRGWILAVALLGVGLDGLVRHRHVRLSGMRVSARELTGWSFLMASAHGAGLMVLPFVLGASVPPPTDTLHHHHAASLGGGGAATLLAGGVAGVDAMAVSASFIHTVGYLSVTAVLAVVVYEKVGLRILRRAWINVNVVWSAAMVAAAVMAVLP